MAALMEDTLLLALRAIKVVTATGKDGPKALSRIMAIAQSAGVPEQYKELLANPDVALIVGRPRTEWAHLFKPDTEGCAIPPDGWHCTRERGHSGPCAAHRLAHSEPRPVAGEDAEAVIATVAGAADYVQRFEAALVSLKDDPSASLTYLASQAEVAVRYIKRLLATHSPAPTEAGLRAEVAAVVNEMSRLMPHATEDWRARLTEALA